MNKVLKLLLSQQFNQRKQWNSVVVIGVAVSVSMEAVLVIITAAIAVFVAAVALVLLETLVLPAGLITLNGMKSELLNNSNPQEYDCVLNSKNHG